MEILKIHCGKFFDTYYSPITFPNYPQKNANAERGCSH